MVAFVSGSQGLSKLECHSGLKNLMSYDCPFSSNLSSIKLQYIMTFNKKSRLPICKDIVFYLLKPIFVD